MFRQILDLENGTSDKQENINFAACEYERTYYSRMSQAIVTRFDVLKDASLSSENVVFLWNLK